MLVAFVLMLEAIVFYTLYQQMPTSLNFFAINNVECNFLGIDFNPQSFQFLNTFWIVVMSPILAFLYTHYGAKKKDMSLASKFALGMTLSAISFSLLYFTKYFNNIGVVSAWWLVATYFFQSTGELLISALGLAMVAELVPRKLVGFIMGMWFLTTAIAGVTGAYVATLTAAPAGITGAVNTLPIYTKVFLQIGLATFVVAAIMWATSPFLNKYIYSEE
jgi:proton-dependent oligopeptide transporter, POT family